MRLKSALRRGVAAAVIAGIVVSSGIPAYAKTWNIADGDITVKGASDESGNYNNVKQGDKDFEKDTDTVITSKSDKSEAQSQRSLPGSPSPARRHPPGCRTGCLTPWHVRHPCEV